MVARLCTINARFPRFSGIDELTELIHARIFAVGLLQQEHGG